MTDGVTTIAGIEIPSTSPVFLTLVGFHVLLGLTCVVTGFVAMMSPKRRGRHSRFGTIYYWCLSALFVSATALSAMRWAENYHLFVIGAFSFAAAFLGRTAARRPQPARRFDLHVTGMSLSYIFMLTAFYVDNGKSLPLWKELPAIVLWLLPAGVGIQAIQELSMSTLRLLRRLDRAAGDLPASTLRHVHPGLRVIVRHRCAGA